MALISMTLGTITFNGSADGNGTLWRAQAIEGWEGATIRQSFHPKLGATGSVIGEANLDKRVVILTGNAFNNSATTIWTSYEALVNLCEGAVTTPISFAVTQPNATKTLASCYVSAPLKLGWHSDKFFRYQIEITAPVPTKA